MLQILLIAVKYILIRVNIKNSTRAKNSNFCIHMRGYNAWSLYIVYISVAGHTCDSDEVRSSNA